MRITFDRTVAATEESAIRISEIENASKHFGRPVCPGKHGEDS
jgi:hypothetical protein